MTSFQEFVPDSLEAEPEIPVGARDQIAGLAIELAMCATGPTQDNPDFFNRDWFQPDNREKILQAASLLMVLCANANEVPSSPTTEVEFTRRRGMRLEWLAKTLLILNGKALSFVDLARVVYGEKEGQTTHNINVLMHGSRADTALRERLQSCGYELIKYQFKPPDGMAQTRFLCLQEGQDVKLDLSRPTQEELDEVALRIRQEEWEYRHSMHGETSRQKERARIERDKQSPLVQVTVFLEGHKNEQFSIAELVPIAYTDGTEDPALYERRLYRMFYKGGPKRRLEERGLALHKGYCYKPEQKAKAVMFMCTERDSLPTWTLGTEHGTEQEKKKHQREVNRAWSEHLRQSREIDRQTKENARREIADWKKMEKEQESPGRVLSTPDNNQGETEETGQRQDILVAPHVTTPYFLQKPGQELSEEVREKIRMNDKRAKDEIARARAVSHAIKFLQDRAGIKFPLDKKKPQKVRINNSKVVGKLFEAGVVGETQLLYPDLDIPEAVAAIMINVEGCAQFFTPITRQATIAFINERLDKWKVEPKKATIY